MLNRTLGRWVRVVDLLLDHHLDEGRALGKEADHVAKRALIVMVGDTLTDDDAVLLLDSSKLRLPQSLEDSSVEDIRAFLDGRADDDAPPGEDGDGGLVLSEDPAGP